MPPCPAARSSESVTSDHGNVPVLRVPLWLLHCWDKLSVYAGSHDSAGAPRPAGPVQLGNLWVSGRGPVRSLGQPCWQVPAGPRGHATATRRPCGSLRSLPAARLQLAQAACRTKAESGPTSRMPCNGPHGEGRWWSPAWPSSSHGTRHLMRLWLQNELWAAALGVLWLVVHRGWKECPGRGLALDGQHPGTMVRRVISNQWVLTAVPCFLEPW